MPATCKQYNAWPSGMRQHSQLALRVLAEHDVAHLAALGGQTRLLRLPRVILHPHTRMMSELPKQSLY